MSINTVFTTADLGAKLQVCRELCQEMENLAVCGPAWQERLSILAGGLDDLLNSIPAPPFTVDKAELLSNGEVQELIGQLQKSLVAIKNQLGLFCLRLRGEQTLTLAELREISHLANVSGYRQHRCVTHAAAESKV